MMIAESSTISAPGLSVRAAPMRARFSLRFRPENSARAQAAWGGMLPVRIGEMTRHGEREALMLGPDEWTLTAPERETAAIVAAFGGAGFAHSLVDISDREIAFDIEGPCTAFALNAGIAFDVPNMRIGSGCRTLFDKAQVVLTRPAAEHYRVSVWRSFVPHVTGMLGAVAEEIAAGV